MSLPATAAILVSVAALFSYVNHRWLRLPTTIGLMLLALAASAAILGLGSLGVPVEGIAREALASVDFDRTLMTGMLSFLLFAGALHIDLTRLAHEKWAVGFLAIIGVLLATALVGFGTYGATVLLGYPMPLLWCLVFGALIAPTDPIAVLSIVKSAGASPSLEMKIAGESLFNDGVAVVVFLELAAIASGSTQPDVREVGLFFAQEALGGVAFGLAIGYVAFLLLRSVDNYELEVLLTVALVMGGYAAATALHLSGPIAIVVAGLLIGNRGRALAMSERTRAHLDTFWELIDSILNAVLFVLIGLEALLLPYDRVHLLPALLAVPVVLAARWVSVLVPALLPYLRNCFDRHAVRVLTWGGLRGGISVALALSLDESLYRERLIAMTYACVAFSIIVQGLSIGRIVAPGRQRQSRSGQQRVSG